MFGVKNGDKIKVDTLLGASTFIIAYNGIKIPK
jgi:hypothetical protein